MEEDIRILLTSGFGGSVVRVLLRPEKKWHRWVIQVAIGVTTAVFLGQLLGHLIKAAIGAEGGPAAYAAAGFLIGTAAERAIEYLQNRFLDTKEDKETNVSEPETTYGKEEK